MDYDVFVEVPQGKNLPLREIKLFIENMTSPGHARRVVQLNLKRECRISLVQEAREN